MVGHHRPTAHPLLHHGRGKHQRGRKCWKFVDKEGAGNEGWDNHGMERETNHPFAAGALRTRPKGLEMSQRAPVPHLGSALGTVPVGLLQHTNLCKILQTAGPGVIRNQLREPITAFRQELQSSKCSKNQSTPLTLVEVPQLG